MAADSLAALGLELREEAIRWLAELTPAALPDGNLAARELFAALGALEAEVADAASDEVELTRLQAWLTAGFFAQPEPFAPSDVVVAEVMEDARRAEAAAGAAGGTGSVSADAGASAAGMAGEVRGSARVDAARGGGAWGGTSVSADGGARSDTSAQSASRAYPGANEFAAGNSQSPPSRNPGREIVPPTRDPAYPAAARGDADRTQPASGGIQGLAALAALAGRGGVEIPVEREDADHPREMVRGASDRTVEPDVGARDRAAHRVDADRAAVDARRTVDERGWPSSDARSGEPSRAGAVDAEAGRLPPRVIRIPFTPPAMEDADGGWADAAPLPIPFLSAPDEAEDARHDAAAAPVSDARAPMSIPTMRVFDGAAMEPMAAPDTGSSAVSEWEGFEAPRESAESFLARTARLAGQRLRPAIVREAAPVVEPIVPPEPEIQPTVLAREVVAPERPIEWPAPDVTDLLDALASEIAHEYRRYYGE